MRASKIQFNYDIKVKLKIFNLGASQLKLRPLKLEPLHTNLPYNFAIPTIKHNLANLLYRNIKPRDFRLVNIF